MAMGEVAKSLVVEGIHDGKVEHSNKLKKKMNPVVVDWVPVRKPRRRVAKERRAPMSRNFMVSVTADKGVLELWQGLEVSLQPRDDLII